MQARVRKCLTLPRPGKPLAVAMLSCSSDDWHVKHVWVLHSADDAPIHQYMSCCPPMRVRPTTETMCPTAAVRLLLACAAAQGAEQADAEFAGIDSMALYVDAWDAGCPWRPWAVHSDPVGAFTACMVLDTNSYLQDKGVNDLGSSQ